MCTVRKCFRTKVFTFVSYFRTKVLSYFRIILSYESTFVLSYHTFVRKYFRTFEVRKYFRKYFRTSDFRKYSIRTEVSCYRIDHTVLYCKTTYHIILLHLYEDRYFRKFFRSTKVRTKVRNKVRKYESTLYESTYFRTKVLPYFLPNT